MKYIYIAAIRQLIDGLGFEESEIDDYEYHFGLERYWITVAKDESEITVGFGAVHRHFSDLPEELNSALIFFKKILSHDILIKEYHDSNGVFKTTYELISGENKEGIGSVSSINWKFWLKKKIIKIDSTLHPKLIQV